MKHGTDDFDSTRPCYLLLGWHDGRWSLVTDELLTFIECALVHEKGIPPYQKFLTVSKAEYETLGMPTDWNASIYFSVDSQREVSLRSNSGKREKKHGD